MTERQRTIEHVACRRCGASNGPAAAFCSACGAYLTWWGETVSEVVVDEIDDRIDDRIDWVGLDPTKPGVGRIDAASPGPIHPHLHESPHLSAMILRVAEQLHLHEHLHRQRVAAGEHRLQAPESFAEFVEAPEPIEVELFEPAPVLPSEETHLVHHLALAVERPEEHGRLCPGCDTGNAPHRSFCRHCGAELHQRVVSVEETRSWWRHLRDARRERVLRSVRLDDSPLETAAHHHGFGRLHLPKLKRPDAPKQSDDPAKQPDAPKAAAAAPASDQTASAAPMVVPPVSASKHLPAARSHPPDFNALRAGLGKDRVVSRLFPRLGLAITLGAAVGSMTIWRNDVGAMIHTALVKAQLLADVGERTLATQAVSATASVPGRVPAHLSDGTLQTYWAVPAASLATTSVTITLPSAEKVSSLGLSIGIQNGDAVFKEQPRPHHLEISFDDGSTEAVTLSDTESFQRHDIADHVTQTITVTILDTYPAVNGTGDWVAISEIVPLQRRV